MGSTALSCKEHECLYGRRSEKQQTPRCGRRRGQRSGAPGHGRTAGQPRLVQAVDGGDLAEPCAAAPRDGSTRRRTASASETGAELAGHLYSVFGTLALAGLRPYPWLMDYLRACAASGGRPPADARAADGQPLALFGFGAAAWKTAPRDRFVGWTDEHRRCNLPFVVNNARFLILPWIRIPNLASHLLAQVQRRLPDDWERRYAIRPSCWRPSAKPRASTAPPTAARTGSSVGKTQGRGKLDRHHEFARPVKDIYLKPLRHDWKTVLNQ